MKNWIWAIIAFLVLVMFSQISFELGKGEFAIPITGQSLIILLIGYVFGAKIGSLVLITYLIMGGLGLPVFAEFGSGWSKFLGGSSGYLLGFLPAMCTASSFGLNKNSYKNSFLAMMLGTLVLLLIGWIGLYWLYGLEKSVEFGITNLWKGALIKILLGTVLGFYLKKLIPLNNN